LFEQDQAIIFCRPFALNEACGPQIRQHARDLCFAAAEQIVGLMDAIKTAMPAAGCTALNGHIHSLLYAAWVCLYESLLDDSIDNVDGDRVIKAQALLRRIMAMLEAMSDFRPAAEQALKNLKDALARADTAKASAYVAGTSADSSLPLGEQGIISSQSADVLQWPTDVYNAFLFSSAQYPNASESRPQDSDNTWLSTAALFQCQGDWPTLR
jgi:hypothetical protein